MTKLKEVEKEDAQALIDGCDSKEMWSRKSLTEFFYPEFKKIPKEKKKEKPETSYGFKMIYSRKQESAQEILEGVK